MEEVEKRFLRDKWRKNEDIKTMEKYLHTSISLNHRYERIVGMRDDVRHSGTKDRGK